MTSALKLKRTYTAARTFSTGELSEGEIGINITDKKIYIRDNGGNIILLVDGGASGGGSLTLTGDVTGTGTGTVATTLATSGVTAGTYTKVTVDAKGRVTVGANITSADVSLGNVVNSLQVINAGGGVSLASGVASSRPAFGTAGRFYYATDTNALSYDSGSAWASIQAPLTGDVTTSGSVATLAASGVTAGTYTKVTVDAKGRVTVGANLASGDVTTALGYTPVNLNGDTMTGLLILSGDSVTGLGAVTKNQLDAAITGLSWKNQVKAATTANITLSGTQTVDGVALIANDRCLVKNQTTTSQNGIYLVASGSWTRSADSDTPDEINGEAVYVQLGTLNKATGWTQTATVTTLGTDPVTYAQFSGSGAYVAGTGLSLTGNTFANTGVLSLIAGTNISVSTSTGNITVGITGQIAVANGGTGAATLTGYVKGNGTSAMTASSTIPSTDISGLGTMATQAASSVSITGGTIDGVTIDCGTYT